MTGFGLVSWKTASPLLGPAIWLEVSNSFKPSLLILYHLPTNCLSSPSKLLRCLCFGNSTHKTQTHPNPTFQHLNVMSNHRWRSLGSLGGALDGSRDRSAVVNLILLGWFSHVLTMSQSRHSCVNDKGDRVPQLSASCWSSASVPRKAPASPSLSSRKRMLGIWNPQTEALVNGHGPMAFKLTF